MFHSDFHVEDTEKAKYYCLVNFPGFLKRKPFYKGQILKWWHVC